MKAAATMLARIRSRDSRTDRRILGRYTGVQAETAPEA
jgi:hypothetical protein